MRATYDILKNKDSLSESEEEQFYEEQLRILWDSYNEAAERIIKKRMAAKKRWKKQKAHPFP